MHFFQREQPNPVLTSEGVFLLNTVVLGAKLIAERKRSQIAPSFAVHKSDGHPKSQPSSDSDTLFLKRCNCPVDVNHWKSKCRRNVSRIDLGSAECAHCLNVRINSILNMLVRS
jgi:hypothetical protein